ncbi:MAG: HEPN domain-containing protein [Clostridiales bacterium]|nr:HEPN domain-containing protein [Clostridiales bacterium]
MEQREDIGTRDDLVKYRLKTAKDDLRAARLLFDANEYKAANNRAYYAIFRAVNAVHAMDGKAYRRHEDAIANFNKEYVKAEIFPRKIGRKITQAEEIRHASDYDDFYIATLEEAAEQIETAEELIEMIESYCVNRMEEAGND